MKIIEESLLKNTMTIINQFHNEHLDMNSYYDNITQLNIDSLQNFSFQKDNEFFDEVSFVLSVIYSIVTKPHINTKREEIIIRSELAGHIDNESFQQVFKDSQLWKEKDFDMVPEYIHYHQHIDELKIYENIFVGMLINLIDRELTKYSEFYVTLLPSFGSSIDTVLVNDEIEDSLNKVNRLRKKLLYIKHSHFYKEISKCNLALRKIQPTNILLKDRLYNHCFKFYRKFIVYEDLGSLQQDFRKYYFNLILQTFNSNSFLLDLKQKQEINDLKFKFKDLHVNLILEENKPYITLAIRYKNINVKHYLVLDTDRIVDKEILENNKFSDCKTVDILSLWNLYDLESNGKPIFSKTLTEEEMIRYWINSKFEGAMVKKEIYTKYCPVCRSANISNEDNLYHCSNCHSEYVFKGIDDVQDVIWFTKIRRV